MVGVITAVGVYLIYNGEVPSHADIMASQPHDQIIEKSRKQAAWKSFALVGVVFFVARDINSYIISGAALAITDLTVKHANAVHPGTGKIDTTGSGDTVAPGMADSYPLADYGDDQ